MVPLDVGGNTDLVDDGGNLHFQLSVIYPAVLGRGQRGFGDICSFDQSRQPLRDSPGALGFEEKVSSPLLQRLPLEAFTVNRGDKGKKRG